MNFLNKLFGRGRQAGEPPTVHSPAAGFAVIDVETTGLSPEQHRILEIAVIRTDPWGRVLHEWSTRINPEGPVGATHVHEIKDSDVANAPTFAQVVSLLSQWLAGHAIVAHHAKFDLAFLRAEYQRVGWALPQLPSLCTLEASQHHLPHLDRRRLADCCWAAGIQLDHAHSALGDARATAGLLASYMHPHHGVAPRPEHVALPAQALAVMWPTGPTAPPRAGHTPQRPASPAPRVLSDRALFEINRKASTAGDSAPLTFLVAERFSLLDAIDEGAPKGSLAYLEKLAAVLEDGEITADEASELAAVAEAEELSSDDLEAANLAFMRALAQAALEDGKVTRSERAELLAMASLLGVHERAITVLLDQAEAARDLRLSTGLRDLPADWSHGEPLRVGDKIVFTGCEPDTRTRLENRSTDVGVRILGSVSPKIAALVTDGSMDGTKAARARELGTRVIDPARYELLLDFLQPALPRTVRSLPQPKSSGATGKHSASRAVPLQDATPSADPALRPNPALVRAWARQNGHEVGTRGRIHHDLIKAYLAAQDAESQ